MSLRQYGTQVVICMRRDDTKLITSCSSKWDENHETHVVPRWRKRGKSLNPTPTWLEKPPCWMIFPAGHVTDDTMVNSGNFEAPILVLTIKHKRKSKWGHCAFGVNIHAVL